MPNSTLQDPNGNFWPLGFVAVPAPGTPVRLTFNVDPGNNNAPGTRTGPGFGAGEYTPVAHRIWIQAYKPGGNNTAMQFTSGRVYVLQSLGPNNQNSGGSGNASDTGVIITILEPGGFTNLPAMEMDGASLSPYRVSIDADVAGDGAIVTLINCSKG